AFHVSARLLDAARLHGLLSNAVLIEVWIALRFKVIGYEEAGQKDDHHRGQHRPTMLLIAGHPTEHIRQSSTDRKDRHHLNESRQGRGVLERMRRVCVEEAATVCAELFDNLLRSYRTLRKRLTGYCLTAFLPGVGVRLSDLLRFNERGLSVGFEILDDPL